MNIAKILKELRHKNGFSQAQLAAMVGVKTSAVSRWEVGTVNPNLEMAVKLATALEVSMDVFCGISQQQVSDLEKLAKKANVLPKDKVQLLEGVLKEFLR